MTQGVRETSLSSFAELRRSGRLTRNQSAILTILDEIGPSHDLRVLEALNQQEQVTLKNPKERRVWTINSVTSLRNCLIAKRLIVDCGCFIGSWCGNRRARHLWRLTGDLRPIPAGWIRCELSVKQKARRTPPLMVRLAGQILRRQPRRSKAPLTSQPAAQTTPTAVAVESLPEKSPAPQASTSLTERSLFEIAPVKDPAVKVSK